jgi:serine/threonine protein kinase
MAEIHCPSCDKGYQIADDKLGGRAQCNGCGHTFTLSIAADETMQPRPQPKPSPAGAPKTPAAPKKLGQYIVQKKLGAGAMGEVWLAHDPVLERDVAIKVIPAAIAQDAERRQRFLREAKLASRLHHTNAVTVYQAGEHEQAVFIAMELVDGQSLDKTIAATGPLPWREATRVLCDAAQGLAAAHELGLVHRDVKPANLMRTAKGVTKVVDFGLARAVAGNTQLTQEGALLGTPAYMAPEQWMGGEADARSDLYSLICTYYFLLTRQLPFDAPSLPSLGYQHRYEPFPDPRNSSPHLPKAVCRILQRGSQKDPANRYQTAAELIADLQALLEPQRGRESFSVSAASSRILPQGPRADTEKDSRPLSRRAWWSQVPPTTRWIAAGCGGAALLLLLGIILLIPTPKGTIKIELDDPQAVVVVDQQTITTPTPSPVAQAPTLTNSIGMELRKSWSDSLAFGTSPAVRAGCVLHDHYQKRRLDGPAATGGVGHLSRNRTQMSQQIRGVYFASATLWRT